RLGDMRAFEEYVALIGTEHSKYSWRAIFTEKFTYEETVELLERCDPELRRSLLAPAALYRFNNGDEEGGLTLIKRFLENPEMTDYESFRVAALFGIWFDDYAVQQQALSGLVKAAVRSDDPLKIVDAAVFWKERLPSVMPQYEQRLGIRP
ncbi:MAG: hypothetical protein KAJ19_11565, partial [Gammaproteobacteria bacterium]|nr:hypothetical protein [Gammaproteobacteria bacterium]